LSAPQMFSTQFSTDRQLYIVVVAFLPGTFFSSPTTAGLH
jgi:hypothetical protein